MRCHLDSEAALGRLGLGRLAGWLTGAMLVRCRQWQQSRADVPLQLGMGTSLYSGSGYSSTVADCVNSKKSFFSTTEE